MWPIVLFITASMAAQLQCASLNGQTGPSLPITHSNRQPIIGFNPGLKRPVCGQVPGMWPVIREVANFQGSVLCQGQWPVIRAEARSKGSS